jgi:hypothetical protein
MPDRGELKKRGVLSRPECKPAETVNLFDDSRWPAPPGPLHARGLQEPCHSMAIQAARRPA